LALVQPIRAQSTGAETVALVSGADYAPFADPDLPRGGLVTEVVQRAFQLEGITATVEFLPWKRGYQALKAGDFAATYPYVATPERQAEMLFSEPLYAMPIYLAFRKGRERRFTGPESLRHLTLCQPLGFALPAAFIKPIQDGDIGMEQPLQMQLCAQMLAQDRVDFLLISPCLYKYVVQPAAGVETVLGTDLIQVSPLYLLAPRADPKSRDLIRTFNEGLGRLRESGEWAKIVDSQLGQGGLACLAPPAPEPPF
jgi:polar amino acid transport system substrate-binding protein